MQRSIGLLVLLGFLFPTAARSLEYKQTGTLQAESEIVSGDEPSVEAVPSGVNIEERVQLEASDEESRLVGEYTFSGNANDLIVAYWDADDGSHYGVSPVIYDFEGNIVDGGGRYLESFNFSEYRGANKKFALPAMGTYRIVFTAYSDGYSSAHSVTEVPDVTNYLLRVRVASSYEQHLVSARDSLDNEQYQQSFELFSAAISEKPNEPSPYMGRLYSQAGLAIEQTELEEDDISTPTDLYALYSRLDASAQAQVIFDLKAFEKAVAAAMEKENLTEKDLGIELELFSAIAQYFETGEQPEYLKLLMKDSERLS